MELLCATEELEQISEYRRWFPVVQVVQPGMDFYLHYDAGLLKLCRADDSRGVWLEADEIRRRLKGDFMLGRACGIRRGLAQEVLDATAGLGMDGLALALSGQRVTLVEREPVLWSLLHNLLERMGMDDVVLIHGDSSALLEQPRAGKQGEHEYDVVYFDPMFPERRKSALPGKRMQYLDSLLGGAVVQETRSERAQGVLGTELIERAQECCRSRVIVKRRLKDPAVGRPDWDVRGRSVRYDVYRGKA